jgi:hypothetical protein
VTRTGRRASFRAVSRVPAIAALIAAAAACAACARDRGERAAPPPARQPHPALVAVFEAIVRESLDGADRARRVHDATVTIRLRVDDHHADRTVVISPSDHPIVIDLVPTVDRGAPQP